MRRGLTFECGVWIKRARNAAIAVAVLLVVVGIVGFFIAPGIVRSVAETQIAEQLGRKATIGRVRLNPYLLAATIEDFTLYEADGRAVAAHVDRLTADVSSASLWKRALVFDAFKVEKPTLSIVRLDPQRFNFSDIVDRLAAKPKSDPTRFSVNNIEIDDGTIDVEDRVAGRKHRVDGLRIALPFLSNLPYDTAIFVTPEFAARVDGSAIALTGKAQPFSASREAALDLDIADLDLTDYLGLSPVKLPFGLASGKLAAKLALVFKAATEDAQGQAIPQSLNVAGHVGVRALDLVDPAGRSAVRAKALDVDIAKLDPFSGDVALDRVAVVAPQVDATRRADGTIDLVALFRLPTAATPAPAPLPGKAPPVFTIAALKVDDGSVRFVDQTLKAPETTSITDIVLEASAIALQAATPTTFHLTLKVDGASADLQGSAVVAARTATGSIAIKDFGLTRLAPYLASTLAAHLDDGRVDFAARYRIDASGATPAGTIDAIALHVAKLRTSLPNEKSTFVGADAIALEGGSFDLGTRAFAADVVTLTAPVVAVRRDANGVINLRAALVDANPASTAPAAPDDRDRQGVAVTVQPAAARAFTAVIKSFAIDRGDVSFEDLAVRTPVRVRAQPFNLKAQNVGTAADATIPFDLDASIDQRGKLAIRGKVTVAPLALDATVDAKRVAVGWLAAYTGDLLNIVVDSADLNSTGVVKVARGKASGKGGAAPLDVAYRGSLGIARMRALDKATSQEFVRWKTLDIPKVDLQMPAKNAPFALTLGTVALDDFYARVIINANGRLNLQDVVAVPGQRQSVTTPDAQPTPEAPTTAASGRKAPTPTVATLPASSPPPIRVDGVKLTGGRIGITDNFIKPNYSADLTDLAGQVAAIASDDPKPADLKLEGRINGDGALEISGGVDPFAPLKYTDISAVAKDIELTRLTPYAIKYAGYAIDRGKLSMTVKYHIVDGKLDAQNRLFLDQLTFGQKVESPTATKLPVLLAVSLLKNSRGEIDINLPISGSLSDPQFSVGGVIARVLVNVITRAISSPFSLLASVAGAGGSGSDGQLGYVQFAPGTSELTAQGKAKLETLAKALADRPALKLDIIGRFDPATDVAGLERDHLLDRLKDLKAKDLSKGGDRVGRDAVTIAPNEYAAYLTRVYDDATLPGKPRNLLGIAKSVPVEEMEKLLLADIKLDPNDPRWLAEARADVVRHDIEDTGKVAASRVFLVTPKLDARGIDDPGVASRVDFALR